MKWPFAMVCIQFSGANREQWLFTIDFTLFLLEKLWKVRRLILSSNLDIFVASTCLKDENQLSVVQWCYTDIIGAYSKPKQNTFLFPSFLSLSLSRYVQPRNKLRPLPVFNYWNKLPNLCRIIIHWPDGLYLVCRCSFSFLRTDAKALIWTEII